VTDTHNYLLNEDMRVLEATGSLVAYAAGDVILGEAAENRKLFWLKKGFVRVELDRLFPGVTLARIGAGEMFGEISFLSDGRASANVIADEAVEVLEVEREDLDRLIAANDAFAARFYHTTSATLIQRLSI
jgi:CRP/FNR family cyclic AMP-dependent transcriptional regulator